MVIDDSNQRALSTDMLSIDHGRGILYVEDLEELEGVMSFFPAYRGKAERGAVCDGWRADLRALGSQSGGSEFRNSMETLISLGSTRIRGAWSSCAEIAKVALWN